MRNFLGEKCHNNAISYNVKNCKKRKTETFLLRKSKNLRNTGDVKLY